jgi:hypothetical protein
MLMNGSSNDRSYEAHDQLSWRPNLQSIPEWSWAGFDEGWDHEDPFMSSCRTWFCFVGKDV